MEPTLTCKVRASRRAWPRPESDMCAPSAAGGGMKEWYNNVGPAGAGGAASYWKERHRPGPALPACRGAKRGKGGGAGEE